MCAGDLGMYRVMPWSYPPISGGTSGGFSPDGSTSEGGESGGGSHSDVTFYKGPDTVAEITDVTNMTQSVSITVSAGYLSVGNLNGIATIDRTIVIDGLFFDDDPSNNRVGILKFSEATDTSKVPPYTEWVNSVASFSRNFEKSVYIEANVYAIKAHLEYRGYNSDGVLIRTGSISMDEWRSS